MEKLNTIQKREKLNEVFIKGEKGNGGAYHSYIIDGICQLYFQNGHRKDKNSISGIIDVDLLEIVRQKTELKETY